VGGRGRPKDDSTEGEKTQSFPCSIRCETVRFRPQRTAVSSKCFHLYYTCSDRLLTIALPSCSFHLSSPLTVTFPKLSDIFRPLYWYVIDFFSCWYMVDVCTAVSWLVYQSCSIVFLLPYSAFNCVYNLKY
jgi:hypothetical protein